MLPEVLSNVSTRRQMLGQPEAPETSPAVKFKKETGAQAQYHQGTGLAKKSQPIQDVASWVHKPTALLELRVSASEKGTPKLRPKASDRTCGGKSGAEGREGAGRESRWGGDMTDQE